ncbi:MAG: bile acid:sodium symporter family protein, partial [Marinobacter sp.]|nr:bile acid:sodium symporter family protein [Marinobacter sp.]
MIDETLVTFINVTAIPLSLFLIMLGMGMTLTIKDFKRVALYPKAVAIGLTNQLLVLPIVGFVVASTMPLSPEL